MTEFLLVRHASHDLLGSRLAGRMPGVSLNAAGRKEAERLAARLKAAHARLLATSPRARCLETAASIARATGLSPVLLPSLDEIDFGTWTGLAFEDLDRDPVWRRFNECRSQGHPPGGEAMTLVERRVMSCLEALHREHDGATVIVVSHGDVLRAVVARVLGVGLDGLHRFVIDPASVTVLDWWGEESATLVSLNEPVGLAGRAPTPCIRAEAVR